MGSLIYIRNNLMSFIVCSCELDVLGCCNSIRACQSHHGEAPVHVTFVDWIPGICSLLGYLIINLIDKDRVRGDDGFGDSTAVWRARLFLFIGFAFLAGGLAGSVVCLSQNFSSGLTFYSLLDRLGFEIHLAQLPGTIHLLRLRQRFTECLPYAFCCCFVDCS
jgi:hypothetical protein